MNEDLRDYLYSQIPISKAMGVEINQANHSGVEVTAPLDPNSNHMDTAFGGSLGTLLILSGYAYLFHRMKMSGIECHVLIKESKINYLLPVREDLRAICTAPEEEDYAKFLSTFQRRGIARIILTAHIETIEGRACLFSGEFIAQKAQR